MSEETSQAESYKLPEGIYLPETVEELAQYILSHDFVIEARLRRVSPDWLAADMIRAMVEKAPKPAQKWPKPCCEHIPVVKAEFYHHVEVWYVQCPYCRRWAKAMRTRDEAIEAWDEGRTA